MVICSVVVIKTDFVECWFSFMRFTRIANKMSWFESNLFVHKCWNSLRRISHYIFKSLLKVASTLANQTIIVILSCFRCPLSTLPPALTLALLPRNFIARTMFAFRSTHISFGIFFLSAKSGDNANRFWLKKNEL